MKMIKMKSLPARIQDDVQEFMEANPGAVGHRQYDPNAVLPLRDVLDYYLRWNGVIGYTTDVMDIVLASANSLEEHV